MLLFVSTVFANEFTYFMLLLCDFLLHEWVMFVAVVVVFVDVFAVVYCRDFFCLDGLCVCVCVCVCFVRTTNMVQPNAFVRASTWFICLLICIGRRVRSFVCESWQKRDCPPISRRASRHQKQKKIKTEVAWWIFLLFVVSIAIVCLKFLVVCEYVRPFPSHRIVWARIRGLGELGLGCSKRVRSAAPVDSQCRSSWRRCSCTSHPGIPPRSRCGWTHRSGRSLVHGSSWRPATAPSTNSCLCRTPRLR